MSDYLSHIAERAGSTTMAVRPVLPSLFEPVKPGGAFAALSTEGRRAPELGIEHDLQPAGEAGDESRPIHDRVASIKSIFTTASSSAAQPKSESVTERTSASLLNMPVVDPAVDPAVGALAAEPPAVVAPTAESPRKQPVVWPATVQPAELAQSQPIVFEDAKAAFDPLASAEPAPAKHRAADRVATAAPAGRLLISAVAPVPLPPIAIRDRARAESTFINSLGSSKAPTIHVTIGRVEVRAILPAVQPTQSPARSAPKLSLHAYLRSRNGGAG
jgi:hypothetical protein